MNEQEIFEQQDVHHRILRQQFGEDIAATFFPIENATNLFWFDDRNTRFVIRVCSADLCEVGWWAEDDAPVPSSRWYSIPIHGLSGNDHSYAVGILVQTLDILRRRMERDPGWGGAREGAGRRPSEDPKVSLSAMVRGSLVKRIRDQAEAEKISVSQLVDRLLAKGLVEEEAGSQ